MTPVLFIKGEVWLYRGNSASEKRKDVIDIFAEDTFNAGAPILTSALGRFVLANEVARNLFELRVETRYKDAARGSNGAR